MNKLKFFVALWVAKISIIALKFSKSGGTNFPGRIAIKICPTFLKYIGKPKTIIGVTGTNGKTTVSNLIEDILRTNNYTFVDNQLGSNTNSGIATTFLRNSTLFGKAKVQLAVLELDERSCIRIFPFVTPTFLVCTNLSRDSLMRNAHTEFISDLLNKYIPDETIIITNSDDLISSYLKPNNKKTLYSIDKLSSDKNEPFNIVQDIIVCPNCYTKLKYDYVRYHHIGKAHCPSCDFKNMEPDYVVRHLDFSTNNLVLHNKKTNLDTTYKLLNGNIVNAYNLIASVVVLEKFGLTPEEIQKGAENLSVVKTRYNEAETKNNEFKVITQLSKGVNPIASSSSLKYAKEESGEKAVIVILDDKFEDIKNTENISWIYEVDYEFLNDNSIKQVIIAGPRRLDVYARLKFAGIPEDKIFVTEFEKDTPSLVKLSDVNKVVILHDIFLMDVKEKIKTDLINAYQEMECNK